MGGLAEPEEVIMNSAVTYLAIKKQKTKSSTSPFLATSLQVLNTSG